jgi:hypothetical protein
MGKLDGIVMIKATTMAVFEDSSPRYSVSMQNRQA